MRITAMTSSMTSSNNRSHNDLRLVAHKSRRFFLVRFLHICFFVLAKHAHVRTHTHMPLTGEVILPCRVRHALIKNCRFAAVVALLAQHSTDYGLGVRTLCAAWDAACPFLRPADVCRCDAVLASAYGHDVHLSSGADHDHLVGMWTQMQAVRAGANTCAEALGRAHFQPRLYASLSCSMARVFKKEFSHCTPDFGAMNAMLDRYSDTLEDVMDRPLNLNEFCSPPLALAALCTLHRLHEQTVVSTVDHWVEYAYNDQFEQCVRAASTVGERTDRSSSSSCVSLVARALFRNTRKFARTALSVNNLDVLKLIVRDPVFDGSYFGRRPGRSPLDAEPYELCGRVVDGLVCSGDLLTADMRDDHARYAVIIYLGAHVPIAASSLYVLAARCITSDYHRVLLECLLSQLYVMEPGSRDAGGPARKRALRFLNELRRYEFGGDDRRLRYVAALFGTQRRDDRCLDVYNEEVELMSALRGALEQPRGLRLVGSEIHVDETYGADDVEIDGEDVAAYSSPPRKRAMPVY